MYSTSMIFCNDNEDTLLLMENLLGTLAYVGLQPCHNPKEAKPGLEKFPEVFLVMG